MSHKKWKRRRKDQKINVWTNIDDALNANAKTELGMAVLEAIPQEDENKAPELFEWAYWNGKEYVAW